MIPPTRATTRSCASSPARCATPRSASPTCAPSEPRISPARSASPSSSSGTARDELRAGMDEILDYAERRTRAAIAELPDGDYEADRSARGRSGRRRARSSLRVAATIAGEELRLDFSGTADQVEGNLNCPLSVTKSASFFAVRVLTDPDAPPCAGAHRPIEVTRPAGLPAQRPPAGRGRRRQRRDLEPGRRPRARGARRRRPSRAGPGNDEQPHPRRRGVHLLRDDRRRPGRLPGCRRPERDPRRDVEHAQHPGRGPRGRLPAQGHASLRCAAGGAAPDATRRRRHRARDRGPGADALHADHRTPPARAPRAATAARTAPRAATCSTAELPPKTAGELRPGDRLRLETPGGGGFGDAHATLITNLEFRDSLSIFVTLKRS